MIAIQMESKARMIVVLEGCGFGKLLAGNGNLKKTDSICYIKLFSIWYINSKSILCIIQMEFM